MHLQGLTPPTSKKKKSLRSIQLSHRLPYDFNENNLILLSKNKDERNKPCLIDDVITYLTSIVVCYHHNFTFFNMATFHYEAFKSGIKKCELKESPCRLWKTFSQSVNFAFLFHFWYIMNTFLIYYGYEIKKLNFQIIVYWCLKREKTGLFIYET